MKIRLEAFTSQPRADGWMDEWIYKSTLLTGDFFKELGTQYSAKEKISASKAVVFEIPDLIYSFEISRCHSKVLLGFCQP